MRRAMLLFGLVMTGAPGIGMAQVTDSAGISQPAPSAVQRQLEETRRSVTDGRRSGQLSRREARDLKRQVARVQRLDREFARDGLSDSERRFSQMAADANHGLVNAQRTGAARPVRGR